jgi:hypothetical protein
MPEEGTESTASAEGTAGGSNAGTAATSKTYSPEEIERLIAGRVNKVRQGFSDYEDLKAKAARADELETSQQSETDKLRSKAERESEKRAAAEEKARTATERADTALMRAAVVAAAAQANAADPGDVFTLLDKSALTLNDNGDVDGAKDAVTALLKAKPHLLKRSGGGFDGGQQGGSAAQGPSMNDRIRKELGFGPS